jgi:predicted RNA-binding Zn ribbon-like protein
MAACGNRAKARSYYARRTRPNGRFVTGA